VKGIPHPPADPPGAAPAGVTVDVPAGISAAIASDLGWSGGNAIVVDLRELTTDRRGYPHRPHSTNQTTIGDPATRYGRGYGRNPQLIHQKL